MPTFDIPHSLCRFGVARCDVTPPVGIYHRMWGAAKHDRSEGVHRPLTASAMVLRPELGDDVQIVVALDHCLFYQPAVQCIIEQIVESTSCRADQVVVTFSHTHAAGLMDPDRTDMPGGDLIPIYLEQLSVQVGELASEAMNNVRPAVVQYALGRCSLAADRDFWDAESEQYVCGFHPGAPADDTVTTARAVNDAGQLLATIVNYACHPTTLAWDNRLISPDYVGAMREVVEQATSAPCVFLQGASGDLGPREGYVGDVEIADRNGRQLGYAALSALNSLPSPLHHLKYRGPVISGATLGDWVAEPVGNEAKQPLATWQTKRLCVPLNYRPGLPTAEQTQTELLQWLSEEDQARAAGEDRKAAAARAMAERKRRQLTRLADLPADEQFPFPVSMWCIGGAVFVAVEGEPYNFLQSSLRQRFPDTPILVMVLANGTRISYLPEADAYGKGIYQETIALVKQGSLEQLTQAIGDALSEWLDE